MTAVVIVGWLGSTAPALAAPPATYVSGNLGSSIPDNASLDSALDVAATGEIVDVKVAVNVGHARDDQLNFDLVAPDGTVVRSLILAGRRDDVRRASVAAGLDLLWAVLRESSG